MAAAGAQGVASEGPPRAPLAHRVAGPLLQEQGLVSIGEQVGTPGPRAEQHPLWTPQSPHLSDSASLLSTRAPELARLDRQPLAGRGPNLATQSPLGDCPVFQLGSSVVAALRPHIPVAGRLSHFLPFWRQITSDKWVLEVVALGHSLELLGSPRNGLVPTKPPSRFVSAMAEEVASLSQKGAIARVPPDQARNGYCSTYFIVAKKDGGLRPILNLKWFNFWILFQKFKMETLTAIIGVTFPGQWLASVDLKDAYFHVPIRQEHHKYLRFMWQGTVYEFTSLPFGLSSAPRVFTKVLQPLIAYLRLQGVIIYVYLDDILIVGWSQEETREAVRLTVSTLVRAGFILNVSKSEPYPSQDLVFIGGRFRTDLGMVFLPPPRAQALRECVKTFLRAGQYKPAHQFLRLLGLMASCISVVWLARLYMRPIQMHVKDRWAPHLGLQAPIMVTRALTVELLWWLDQSNLEKGLKLQPPVPQLTVTTDACPQGWGGFLQKPRVLLQGSWSKEESALHINVLELRAVRNTFLGLEPQIRNMSVLVESDNTTTVAYLNKQGGVISPSLNRETRQFYDWMLPRGISILAIHRPGVENQLADFLSRQQADPREWSLHPSITDRLFRIWGLPLIDLFASNQNAKLPLFCTRTPEPGSIRTDALQLHWGGWETYAFPPIPLIPKVLTKIRTDRASTILIAPMWPRRLWYPQLLSLSCECPRVLPLFPKLLSQVIMDQGKLLHPDTTTLRLVAWKLSGDSSKSKGFRTRLSQSCWQPDDPQHGGSTTLAGKPSLAGAILGTPIPLLPL